MGISNIIIVGSKEKRLLAGMTANKQCYSNNKIEMLKEVVKLNSYTKLTGFSDSSADIPMLSLCNIRYLVNPTANSLSKFKKAFEQKFKTLHWL